MELDNSENSDKINKLMSFGGKRWTKAGMDRIYFNYLPKLLKIESKTNNYTMYGSPIFGSPKHSSTLNGEPIEFKRAKELVESCEQGKFWYDIKKECFNTSHLYNRHYNIKQMLIDRMNELLGNNEFTEILSDLDDI